LYVLLWWRRHGPLQRYPDLPERRLHHRAHVQGLVLVDRDEVEARNLRSDCSTCTFFVSPGILSNATAPL